MLLFLEKFIIYITDEKQRQAQKKLKEIFDKYVRSDEFRKAVMEGIEKDKYLIERYSDYRYPAERYNKKDIN